MKSALSAITALWGLSAPLWASSGALQEAGLFQSAVELFRDSNRDKAAAVEAFENFLKRYPDGPRAADARFMAGEGYFRQALELLKSKEAKKPGASAPDAAQSEAAGKAARGARRAYQAVLAHYRKSGLGASAQYRLGELEYDQRRWADAVERFRAVDRYYPKSYIVPDAWVGIVYSDLAQEDFGSAENHLYALGESYPHYLKVPAALYAQGLVSLHKGDFAAAEKAFSQVSSPEALFYLGKTYLSSDRPFLAATTFERLIQEYPDSELVEEADFYAGDAFYLSKDFAGAVARYQRFLDKHPDSPLKAAALFRIGSTHFQRRDFAQARASYQSVMDRFPQDYFAPLAQYAVGESYLASGQTREAMFAYAKTAAQFPKAEAVAALAEFKLAWTQRQLGNYAQSAQTCRNFLSSHPSHELAKNVYLLLGNAESSLGESGEAVSAWQRAMDIAPNSETAEQAMFLILQTQYRQRNFGSIVTSYQFIFRHLPPSQSKWRSLAYLYAADATLALNRVAEARAIYEMILKVYPADAAAVYAQDGLAWCYTYGGEDARALEERRKLKEMLSVARSSGAAAGRNELGIADSLFNQKMYDEAFRLYDKFAEGDPGSPEAASALFRAGSSLYRLRYYSQAVETWRKLAKAYPQAPESREALPLIADTLFRTGRYPEAIRAYQELIAKDPDGPQAAASRLRVAHAHFNAADDAAAAGDAAALIARFPDAAQAKDALDLMEAAFDRSPSLRFQEALSAVVRAHPRSEAAADSQFRLARRLFEKKRFAEAAAEFQRFSVDYTGNPRLAKAQFMLAESLLQAGRRAEAVAAFERCLNNFPRSPDTPLALFHAAGARYDLKEFEPAAAGYARLVEEYPESEFVKPALFNMALSFKAVGKLESAQDAYSKYVRLVGGGDPSAVPALWEVFSIQKENKDFDGALDTLRQIRASLKPGSDGLFETLYRTGEIEALIGKSGEAVSTLERLGGMRPSANAFRLQGLVKLGELCEKTDPARAAAAYEDLARSSPNRKIAEAARERAAGLRGALRSKPSGGRRPRLPGAEEGSVQVEPPDDKPSSKGGPLKNHAPD